MITLLALVACTSTPSGCDTATDDLTIVDWHTNTVGTGADLHGIAIVGGDGFAVGGGGAAAWTTDGGEAWVAGDLGEADLFDVARSESAAGVAVGVGGTIARATADADFTWDTVAAGTTADLFAIDLDDRNGVIAGDGVLLRSADAGATWSLTELSGSWRGASIANAGPWAVGDAGAIARWTGSAWEALTSFTTADLHAVAFMDADHGVVTGDGEVWSTEDGGATWTAGTAPTETLGDVAVAGNAFVGVGDGGTVFRSQDGGASWLGIHPSGVAGLAGLSVFEDNSMPNSQFAVAAPGDRVLIYGSRYETTDGGWACE